MTLRILQGSDFHLTPHAAGSKRLSEELRKQLSVAGLEGFRRFCQLAREESVDAVLIPGDLFDGEAVEDTLLQETLHAMAECSCPVLITPGNHDYYSPGSYWSPNYHQQRSIEWPANVHVFSKGEFETRPMPGAEETATVTGICFRSDEAPGGGLKARLPDDDRIHLLLFHGSLLERSYPGKSQPLPFNQQDLLNLGFDYTALGHYHSHIEIFDDSNQLRGAYAGIPQPRWFGEATGLTGCLLLEIDQAGSDSTVRSKLIPLHAHRFAVLEVKIDGCQSETEAKERLRQAVESSGIGEHDFVRLELSGVVAPSLSPTSLAELDLDLAVLHDEIRTGGVLPDYQLETDPPEEDVTVEAAFRRKMLTRIREASEEGDSEAEQLYRRAFSYGMDALRRGDLVARHVD